MRHHHTSSSFGNKAGRTGRLHVTLLAALAVVCTRCSGTVQASSSTLQPFDAGAGFEEMGDADSTVRSTTTTTRSRHETNRGGEVLLTPADDVQRAIDHAPAGTTFTFKPGIYRHQGTWLQSGVAAGHGNWYGIQITKNNTVLQAQTRRTAIFSGAITINVSMIKQRRGPTEATETAESEWVADIRGFTDNTSWPDNTGYGVCEKGFESCNRRQDLFLNNKVLRRYPHRSNLTEVPISEEKEPAWFLDYSTSQAVMNFDPREAAAAGELELSYQDTFLSVPAGVHVTVRGLVIEKIANHAQTSTCEGAEIIDDCEIRWAHGGGVSGRVVTNNHIHHIGQLGAGASSLLENNTVEYCNYANYSYSWEAGGVKVFSNKQMVDQYGPLVIRNNTARYNYGPGLWSDGGGWNISYLSNTLTDNALAGIHHEISFHANIAGNYVSGNCWRYAPWHAGGPSPWSGYCGQITLSTSQNVTIRNNTIEVDPAAAGNYAAVAMYQDPRGTDRHTNRTFYCRNNVVRHNHVIFKSDGGGHIRTGIVAFTNQNGSNWADANMSMDDNVYSLPRSAVDGNLWWWCDGPAVPSPHPPNGGPPLTHAPCKGLTFTEIQSKGQELHSTLHPVGQ